MDFVQVEVTTPEHLKRFVPLAASKTIGVKKPFLQASRTMGNGNAIHWANTCFVAGEQVAGSTRYLWRLVTSLSIDNK